MMYGFIYPRSLGHKIVVHSFPTWMRQEWVSTPQQRTALCGHYVPYSWTWRWHLKAEKPTVDSLLFSYPISPCVRCDRMRIVLDMAS